MNNSNFIGGKKVQIEPKTKIREQKEVEQLYDTPWGPVASQPVWRQAGLSIGEKEKIGKKQKLKEVIRFKEDKGFFGGEKRKEGVLKSELDYPVQEAELGGEASLGKRDPGMRRSPALKKTKKLCKVERGGGLVFKGKMNCKGKMEHKGILDCKENLGREGLWGFGLSKPQKFFFGKSRKAFSKASEVDQPSKEEGKLRGAEALQKEEKSRVNTMSVEFRVSGAEREEDWTKGNANARMVFGGEEEEGEGRGFFARDGAVRGSRDEEEEQPNIAEGDKIKSDASQNKCIFGKPKPNIFPLRIFPLRIFP